MKIVSLMKSKHLLDLQARTYRALTRAKTKHQKRVLAGRLSLIRKAVKKKLRVLRHRRKR